MWRLVGCFSKTTLNHPPQLLVLLAGAMDGEDDGGIAAFLETVEAELNEGWRAPGENTWCWACPSINTSNTATQNAASCCTPVLSAALRRDLNESRI